jgi:hypothetical protein
MDNIDKLDNKMIKKFLFGLSENVKKYIYLSGILTILVSVLILIFSFSFSVAGIVLFLGIVFSACFMLLEFLRNKLIQSKCRWIPIIVSICILFVGGVSFMVNYDFEKGMSYIFSRIDTITSSSELLEMNDDYQNISLVLDSDSVFRTSYKVEKIISQNDSGNESGTVSSIWDGDEWIDAVILERVVLYDYYVFPFDGKYFVAKISPEAYEEFFSSHGNVKIQCVVSAPSNAERQTCNSICSDIVSTLYSVDHFEGEGNVDFFEDLDEIKGEASVLLTLDIRNLFWERTLVSASLLCFILGISYILCMILYAPPMPPIQKNKKQ